MRRVTEYLNTLLLKAGYLRVCLIICRQAPAVTVWPRRTKYKSPVWHVLSQDLGALAAVRDRRPTVQVVQERNVPRVETASVNIVTITPTPVYNYRH